MARPAGHKLSPTAFQDIAGLRGLSLTEIAELSDVKRATLSGLLGGHAGASVPTTKRIAAAMGCHAETLFPTLRAGIEQAAA